MNRTGPTRRPRLRAAATLATLLCAAGAGCGPTSLLITPVAAARKLDEFEVRRDSVWAAHKVALLDVDGALRNGRGGTLTGVEEDNPVSVFQEKLDRAARDPAVRGVVLRINSPGGGVTASDLMYTALQKFRAESGKPVVAFLLDVAASGGYYLACAADRIHAHPTTVTGSIGVIIITPDVADTLARIGVRTNVFKSGPRKDAGSPLRHMEPDDEAVFQALIDQMYERFLAVVQRSRTGLAPERIRALADGSVYHAEQALANGLVDQISTLDEAIDEVCRRAGLPQRPIVVVQYARPYAHRPNIYADAPPSTPQVNILNLELPHWLRGDGPQLLYLWAPGW